MNITLKISKLSEYKYNRANATNNSIQGDFRVLFQNPMNYSPKIETIQLPKIEDQIVEINKKENNPENKKQSITITGYSNDSRLSNFIDTRQPELVQQIFKPNYFKLYILGTLLILILSIIIFVQYENIGTLVMQILIFLISIGMSGFYYFKGNLDLFEEKNAKIFTNLFLLQIILDLTAIIVSIAVQDIYGYQIVIFITFIIMFLYYYYRVRQKNQQK